MILFNDRNFCQLDVSAPLLQDLLFFPLLVEDLVFIVAVARFRITQAVHGVIVLLIDFVHHLLLDVANVCAAPDRPCPNELIKVASIRQNLVEVLGSQEENFSLVIPEARFVRGNITALSWLLEHDFKLTEE